LSVLNGIEERFFAKGIPISAQNREKKRRDSMDPGKFEQYK